MITSIQNPRIKIIRDLLGSKKERDASRLMVLEGVRLAKRWIRQLVSTRVSLANHYLNAAECCWTRFLKRPIRSKNFHSP